MQNLTSKIKKTAQAKRTQVPPALQWLMETFPRAFFPRSKEVTPLQIGIFDEILLFQARLTTPPYSRKSLREALNYYSASPAYLRCQSAHAPRLDLFGAVVDHVTEEQAEYAQQRYASRYNKLKKNPVGKADVGSDLERGGLEEDTTPPSQTIDLSNQESMQDDEQGLPLDDDKESISTIVDNESSLVSAPEASDLEVSENEVPNTEDLSTQHDDRQSPEGLDEASEERNEAGNANQEKKESKESKENE